MAFTTEKANKVLTAIETSGLLDELNSRRMTEICRRVKVSSSVMVEALVSADIIKRVKRGEYDLVAGSNKNEDRLEHFVEIAKQIYRENAEAERKRVAEKTGEPVAEPRRKKLELEPILDRESVLEARVARLEQIVAVLMDKAGIPARAIKTQLKLAQSGAA